MGNNQKAPTKKKELVEDKQPEINSKYHFDLLTPSHMYVTPRGFFGYHQHAKFTSDRQAKVSSFTSSEIKEQAAILTKQGFSPLYGNEEFAIKSISKAHILVRKDYIEAAWTERNALAALATYDTFVERLFFSYQDEENIYLATNLLYHPQYENLHSCLEIRGRMTEDEVRFIMAEIICGLEIIHACQIVHRDLTLRHIILDKLGHAYITAFENCKHFGSQQIRGRLRVRAKRGDADKRGSDQSPEVLTSLEYGVSPDFWSLGIMIFELLHWDLGKKGSQPFESPLQIVQLYEHHQKRSELGEKNHYFIYDDDIKPDTDPPPEVGNSTAGDAYHRYLHSIMKPSLSKDAKDLLEGLLCLNRFERLGCNGIDKIKNHSFFNPIDFDMIKTKKHISPFKYSDKTRIPLKKRIGRKLKPIGRTQGAYSMLNKLSNAEQDEFNWWEFDVLNHTIFLNHIIDQLHKIIARDVVKIIIDFILSPRW